MTMLSTYKWDSLEELSSEDVIDSRDIEKVIEELESDIETYVEEEKEWEEEHIDSNEQLAETAHTDKQVEDYEDTKEFLAALIGIRDEVNSSEWDYGLTLIADSHFEDYCKELADDLGYLGSRQEEHNPLLDCIDWEQWADMCRQDYSSVEIDGTTFYYRN